MGRLKATWIETLFGVCAVHYAVRVEGVMPK